MSEQKSILIVDDEPINQAILTELLEDEYNLDCADDGISCLKAVSNQIPDLILLDVNMPEMTGLEVCRKLYDDPDYNEIPVIFVSALASPEERLAGYHAGGDDYVTKPFNEDELLKKIRLLIDISDRKTSLKQGSDVLTDTLMQNLINTGEIGSVINFIRDSYECQSIDELIKVAFNSLKSNGFKSSILSQKPEQTLYFFDDGFERPLEKEILEQLNFKQERIISFGVRVGFTCGSTTLLVKNMPIDEDKTGRFREHFLILIDALDARMEALYQEIYSAQQNAQLGVLISTTKENLSKIIKQQKIQSEHNTQIITSMEDNIKASFFDLYLSEEQEDSIQQMLTKAQIEFTKLRQQNQLNELEFEQTMMKLFLISFDN